MTPRLAKLIKENIDQDWCTGNYGITKHYGHNIDGYYGMIRGGEACGMGIYLDINDVISVNPEVKLTKVPEVSQTLQRIIGDNMVYFEKEIDRPPWTDVEVANIQSTLDKIAKEIFDLNGWEF